MRKRSFTVSFSWDAAAASFLPAFHHDGNTIMRSLASLSGRTRFHPQTKTAQLGLGQVACNFVFRSSTLDEDEMQAITGGGSGSSMKVSALSSAFLGALLPALEKIGRASCRERV